MVSINCITHQSYRSKYVFVAMLSFTLVAVSACSASSQINATTPVPSPPTLTSNPGIYRANNQRTGEYSTGGIGQASKVVWKQKFDGLIPSPPVLSSSGVYFLSNGSLVELNIQSGAEQWKTSASSDLMPTIVEGVLYYDYKSTLYALDENTKQIKWSFQTDSTWTEFMATANAIYAGTGDGRLLAIDTSGGLQKQKWTRKVGDTIGGLYRPDMAMQNETVYAVSSHVTSAPEVDAPTFEDTVHAVDASTGTELWSFKPTGNIKSISVAENYLFLGTVPAASSPGYIYALSAATGQVTWQKELTYAIWAPLSTTHGILLVGGKTGTLEAIDIKTQSIIWRFQAADAIGGIAIAGDSVYAGSDDHNLYVLNTLSGQTKSTLDIGGDLWAPPVVTEGGVYFLDNSNAYAVH